MLRLSFHNKCLSGYFLIELYYSACQRFGYCYDDVGIILYEVFPKELPFDIVNRVITKKELRDIINECYRTLGTKATAILADRLKDIGYKYATLSGISISIGDMTIPSRKVEILEKAEQEVKKIDDQYKGGLITDVE